MIDSSSEQMRFLLEKARAVRKNNLLHLTDEMDSSLLDHYQKVYRSMLKAGDGKVQPLRMSLDDIEHAEERGRWWLIGSAFNPAMSSREDREEKKKKTEIVRATGFDSRLVTLAERAQLKTEVRRSIFCTMLSAEDEMDAFERLLKLNLKGEQERQIIHIIIVTCTRENPYNPFYCSLLSKFCAFHRRFQLTSQFAFWDRLRELKSVSENRRNNLALLLADAIRLEAVGLSILKIVEFATLDNWTSDVMRRMLERLVMSTTEGSLKDLFNRLIVNSKHRLLCQGLQIFIDMRLKDERERNVMLDKRLSLLETLLESVV